MNQPLPLLTLLCAFGLAIAFHSIADADHTASPSIPGGDGNLVPPRREVYDDGRILDISHRYHPEMPAWESKDGVVQFLWLPKSMKNGSLANNSEMKLPTHTGIHVFDHYFNGGFDVDSLDLHVLNGVVYYSMCPEIRI